MNSKDGGWKNRCSGGWVDGGSVFPKPDHSSVWPPGCFYQYSSENLLLFFLVLFFTCELFRFSLFSIIAKYKLQIMTIFLQIDG